MNSMSIEMALYRTGLGAMPRGLSLMPRLDASARRPYLNMRAAYAVLNSYRGLSRKSLISTISADISRYSHALQGRIRLNQTGEQAKTETPRRAPQNKDLTAKTIPRISAPVIDNLNLRLLLGALLFRRAAFVV